MVALQTLPLQRIVPLTAQHGLAVCGQMYAEITPKAPTKFAITFQEWEWEIIMLLRKQAHSYIQQAQGHLVANTEWECVPSCMYARVRARNRRAVVSG